MSTLDYAIIGSKRTRRAAKRKILREPRECLWWDIREYAHDSIGGYQDGRWRWAWRLASLLDDQVYETGCGSWAEGHRSGTTRKIPVERDVVFKSIVYFELGQWAQHTILIYCFWNYSPAMQNHFYDLAVWPRQQLTQSRDLLIRAQYLFYRLRHVIVCVPYASRVRLHRKEGLRVFWIIGYKVFGSA